jgi:DNA modification methylase
MHWLGRFPIWCEIIWDRCGIGNPTRRYHSQDERIYQIGKPRKWKNSELKLTNIWKFPPSRNDGHVCTFPEKLVENCILPTTDPGDVVIDPYMGSGTTAIVAIKNGRRFIGIESNREYFDFACSRIEELEAELESQIGVEDED